MQMEGEDPGKAPPCDPAVVSDADPSSSDGDDNKPSPDDCCIANEEVDGNQTITAELAANSRRKTMIHKKRLSAMGITKADDEQILCQEMFISILNNQFKWNGKGSFGTFLF